jgi:glutaminyl-tRNA synthetase
MEVPPKKFFRLAPGQMVRLKHAYIIRCDEVIKDADGTITALHCSHLPDSKSGADTSGVNVKGTLHWVSQAHAVPVETRLYDRLFKVEDVANAEGNFTDHMNKSSIEVLPAALAEPALASDPANARFQFIRMGYFYADPASAPDKRVFNRTVTLKDTWAKEAAKG